MGVKHVNNLRVARRIDAWKIELTRTAFLLGGLITDNFQIAPKGLTE